MRDVVQYILHMAHSTVHRCLSSYSLINLQHGDLNLDLISFCLLRSVLPDPDPPSDGGGALAPLLPRRGSLLPPAARGLLPGRADQTPEDLRLEPEARQPGPPHRAQHPGPAAEAAPGLLPPAGREGRVPASAEKVSGEE